MVLELHQDIAKATERAEEAEERNTEERRNGGFSELFGLGVFRRRFISE
jgi:hypothetical protein